MTTGTALAIHYINTGKFNLCNALQLITVDTEITVKLILRKYFVAFAFVLILIGQMIFRIHVHRDTSPRISRLLSYF